MHLCKVRIVSNKRFEQLKLDLGSILQYLDIESCRLCKGQAILDPRSKVLYIPKELAELLALCDLSK